MNRDILKQIMVDQKDIYQTRNREPCFKMKRHTGNVCHICYCTLNFENAA